MSLHMNPGWHGFFSAQLYPTYKLRNNIPFSILQTYAYIALFVTALVLRMVSLKKGYLSEWEYICRFYQLNFTKGYVQGRAKVRDERDEGVSSVAPHLWLKLSVVIWLV